MVEDYRYVEYALGGTNRRNDVRLLAEAPTTNGHVECYRSMLRFPPSLKTYMDDNNGSVSGYKGAAKADSVALDFDDEDDPAKTLEDVRQTLRRLETLGIPLKALGIFYSGHKGFHVEIPEELLGSLEGGHNTAARVKSVARELLRDSETADREIYETMRLWRMPNTKNKKSGLYKVPLYPDEILNLDIEEIRELAKHPRDDFVHTDPGEFGEVEALRELWEKSAHQHKKYEEQRERVDTVKILNGLPEGKRNREFFRLASKFRGSDVPQDAAEHFILEAAAKCDPPFPRNEALTVVASAYERYEPNGTEGAPRIKRPTTGPITASELMETEFQPTNWVISDILPEGVTLLVGKPKKGKS